jgi:hypothetical protein
MRTEMSTEPIIPDSPNSEVISPRLKRKLDKHLAAKERKAACIRRPPQPKPQWAKNLTRNSAAVIFKEQNIKELCADLLRSPDARLRFEVIRYLWDRLEGRPFVAINPAENKAQAPHDPKLLVAIQNLVVNQTTKGKRKAQVIDSPQLTEGK